MTYCEVEGADALVFVTEWEQFRALDLDRIKKSMAAPVVVDLRNLPPRRDNRARVRLRERRPCKKPMTCGLARRPSI